MLNLFHNFSRNSRRFINKKQMSFLHPTKVYIIEHITSTSRLSTDMQIDWNDVRYHKLSASMNFESMLH